MEPSLRRQRGLRVPAPLVFRKPDPCDSTRPSYSNPAITDCHACLGSIPTNPRLCGDCQIWNDLKHVFQCHRDAGSFRESVITLADALSRINCMMCQIIAKSILERFQSHDQSIQDDLLQAEITVCGPYCLGDDILRTLDPSFFAWFGEAQIDRDDPSFPFAPQENLPQSSTAISSLTNVVLYLILAAPSGSCLQQQIPDLDAYARVAVGESPRVEPSTHRSLLKRDHSLLRPTIGLQLSLQHSSSGPALAQVGRWEVPHFDTKLVKGWVHSCIGTHGSECQRDGAEITLPTKFRVIDTNRWCVVEMPISPLARYVALSYCWASPLATNTLQLLQENLEELSQEYALSAPATPSLLIDVINLCRDLDEPYLWVDRLCIVQDDHIAKHSQIQAMDRIYARAFFTIIAALPDAFNSGLPGVRNRPRQSSLWNNTRVFSDVSRAIHTNFRCTVLDSMWNTRGWTYQEHQLSPRCIYITEFQIYFSCNTISQQEEIGEIAGRPRFLLRHMIDFTSHVNSYTSRTLSFESDVLNAFAGICNRFIMVHGGRLLFGLPERYLTQALLWENATPVQQRINAVPIPSWSWAAWRGEIKYSRNFPLDNMRVGTLVRFFFRDPQLGLTVVEVRESWFSVAMSLDSLQGLPCTDKSHPWLQSMLGSGLPNDVWSECPHNPWEASPRILDDDAMQLSSKYPGSLIFVSTIALLSVRTSPQCAEHGSFPNSAWLDIVDNANIVVGQTARMDHSWIGQAFANPDEKHECVVLCAGVSTGLERNVVRSLSRKEQPQQQARQTTHHMVQDASEWYLHVMFIERDQADGVARRIGIGIIRTSCWAQCSPKWTTVVLT